MTSRTLLVAITLVLIVLLIWQLRWVLLVLFGAIVVSVTLDVLIQKLQSKIGFSRHIALILVLLLLIISGLFVIFGSS